MTGPISRNRLLGSLTEAASWPGADRNTVMALATALVAARADAEGSRYFQGLSKRNPADATAHALAGFFQVRAGHDVAAMSDRGRMRLRQETVAYIFQSFGLLPVLSAAENVGVPLRIAGVAPKERESRVELMLSIVGLADHARQRPAELSGGEQQRVAIARALASRPSLLLADEPTGQLDRQTGRQIMRLLQAVVESEGVTALVATHDPVILDLADSVLHLVDGKITG